MSMKDDWTICARRGCGWQGTSEDYVWKPEPGNHRMPCTRGHCPKCNGTGFFLEKPLFIPLKAEFFDAFERGDKTDEYRRRSDRFNLGTCRVGRRVILSRGYGKARRLSGVITAAHYDTLPARLPGWLECYGPNAGDAIVIKISLEPATRTLSPEPCS